MFDERNIVLRSYGRTRMTIHQNVKGFHPLAEDELRRLAPSIFAAEAHESRSSRAKLERFRVASITAIEARLARLRNRHVAY